MSLAITSCTRSLMTSIAWKSSLIDFHSQMFFFRMENDLNRSRTDRKQKWNWEETWFYAAKIINKPKRRKSFCGINVQWSHFRWHLRRCVIHSSVDEVAPPPLTIDSLRALFYFYKCEFYWRKWLQTHNWILPPTLLAMFRLISREMFYWCEWTRTQRM